MAPKPPLSYFVLSHPLVSHVTSNGPGVLSSPWQAHRRRLFPCPALVLVIRPTIFSRPAQLAQGHVTSIFEAVSVLGVSALDSRLYSQSDMARGGGPGYSTRNVYAHKLNSNLDCGSSESSAWTNNMYDKCCMPVGIVEHLFFSPAPLCCFVFTLFGIIWALA